MSSVQSTVPEPEPESPDGDSAADAKGKAKANGSSKTSSKATASKKAESAPRKPRKRRRSGDGEDSANGKAPSRGGKGVDDLESVARAQARTIAELENRLERMQQKALATRTIQFPLQGDAFHPPPTAPVAGPSNLKPLPPSIVPAAYTTTPTPTTFGLWSGHNGDEAADNPSPSFYFLNSPSAMSAPSPHSVGEGSDNGSPRGSVISLVRAPAITRDTHPYLLGWPASLPSPTVVTTLVGNFVTRNLSWIIFIGGGGIQNRIFLPPSSPEFPNTSLVHTLAAVAIPYSGMTIEMASASPIDADWSSQDLELADVQQRKKYWKRAGYDSPGAYHLAKALSEADVHLEEGKDMLSIMQSYMLLSFAAFARAKFVQTWHLLGRGCHIAMILQGHSSEFVRQPPDGTDPNSVEAMTRSFMVGLEREGTTWILYMADAMMEIISGGHRRHFPEERFHTRLPTLPGDGGSDNIRDENFFTHHVRNDSRTYVSTLWMKVAVLVSRVMSLLKNLPVDEQKQPAWSQYQAFVETPEFVQQALHIRQMANSLAVPMRKGPEDYKTDTDFELESVGTKASFAMLVQLLYQPFMSRLAGDVAGRVAVGAAEELVNKYMDLIIDGDMMVGTLVNTAVFMKVTAQTLMKDMAIARAREDHQLANHRRQQLDRLIGSMRRSGKGQTYPVLPHYATMMEMQILRADTLLPPVDFVPIQFMQ